MQRKEKLIEDKSLITTIMQEATVCRIALCENNIPYIVPMNFGYAEEYIYVHSATKGKKLDMLKINNKVCFEVEHKLELVKADKPCNWGMKFYSIIGSGEATFVNDSDEKAIALNLTMMKYSQKQDYIFSQNELEKVAIIKIKINELTGKKSGY